ncbi:YraN family protein [Thermogutta terrifontis]|nr:YraN family protein [Thermogutta terrifontis]
MALTISRFVFWGEKLPGSWGESRESYDCVNHNRPPRNSRRMLGDVSEAAACRFLVQRGYQILARNVRFRSGEVDIVATDGKTWIFVEVRSRRLDSDPDIAETVTTAKQRRVIRAALQYLRSHGGPRRPMRFDVITVLWPKNDIDIPKITHWESAFGCD